MNENLITIETRRLGEVAEEEIAAAREAGINPLEIAETHATLARLIPYLLDPDSDDGPGTEGQSPAEHIEQLEAALKLAQARNRDLEAELREVEADARAETRDLMAALREAGADE